MTLEEAKALKVGDLVRYATTNKSIETIEVVVVEWDKQRPDRYNASLRLVTLAILRDEWKEREVGAEGWINTNNCHWFEKIA